VLVAKLGGREATLDHDHQGLPVLRFEGELGLGVGRQYLRAGLVDEVALHLVPVLLGTGTRLFDDPRGSIGMETIEVIHTDAATHIRLRVIGD
jgi:riboflavin biosynthesis pyrimidine reductase